ncbi:MAG: uroporphyrinogen-III synthase [Pseudomonadota bacterium]
MPASAAHARDPQVWVTRTEPGASHTAAVLRAAGFTVLVEPVLEIEVPDLPACENVATGERMTCAALPTPDLVIALSAHAVVPYAMAACFSPAIPHVGIGAETARKLRDQRVQQVITPTIASSEGVLDMAEVIALKRGVVWLLAGEGGRELLPAVLTSRGLAVFKLSCYRRRPRRVDPQQLGGVHIVAVASLEGLREVERLRPADSAALVVASERIEEAARGAGYRAIERAQDASPAATLAAVQRLAKLLA